MRRKSDMRRKDSASPSHDLLNPSRIEDAKKEDKLVLELDR